jgi:hypothetical protein
LFRELNLLTSDRISFILVGVMPSIPLMTSTVFAVFNHKDFF